MTPSTLADKVKELDQKIEAKTTEAQQKWAAFDAKRKELAESDADLSEGGDAFEEAHQLHAQYGEAADEVDQLKTKRQQAWAMTSERDASRLGLGGPANAEQREQIREGLHSAFSLAERIVASDAYKALEARDAFNSSARLGEVHLGRISSRDEMHSELVRESSVIVADESGADTVGAFIQPERRGLLEPRFRPLMIRDLITVGTTDSDSIEWIKETGFVNNAAAVPEAQSDAPIGDGTGGTVTPTVGGRKPQSRLSYEKESTAISTLAHWMAATKKSLADVSRLRTTIDARLRRGLLDVTEDQIIDGDGVGENLTGILNTTGLQHQERGAGPLIEDILRAMTKVELAFFRVQATGLNPLDWQDVRLMRDNSGGAGTGGYLFGSPSEAGDGTLWGRRVVTAPQFPVGQPITGDWRVVEFLIREGIQVIATDSHEDFFIRNMVAILAEFRAGLIIPTPEALCEVSDSTP